MPRVSSKKQVQQGDSITAQENRLSQHSKENNDEVIGIYTDAGKSASISDDKININFKHGRFIIGIDLSKRPAMRKAIEEAPLKKFEGIKFTKWDRFSRNVILSKILQIYFENYSIKLIPTDDSTDPLMVEIKGALSEEEVRKMKERVRFTRLNQFEKGIIVGRCPIGYTPIFKNKRDRRGIIGIKLDKKKAPIIKDIFELTAKGFGYREICDKYKL